MPFLVDDSGHVQIVLAIKGHPPRAFLRVALTAEAQCCLSHENARLEADMKFTRPMTAGRVYMGRVPSSTSNMGQVSGRSDIRSKQVSNKFRLASWISFFMDCSICSSVTGANLEGPWTEDREKTPTSPRKPFSIFR